MMIAIIMLTLMNTKPKVGDVEEGHHITIQKVKNYVGMKKQVRVLRNDWLGAISYTKISLVSGL